MKYFIESVNTLSTTGKSRKGAILQAVVRRFEHTIIADDESLSEFINQLKNLIDVVNQKYSGKDASLQTVKGHIYANSGCTGHEAYIFSISYAPVGVTLKKSDMRKTIIDALKREN